MTKLFNAVGKVASKVDPVYKRFGAKTDILRLGFPMPPDAPVPPTIPDDEEIKRQQRLLAAKPGTGRASTILSEPPTDVFGK